MPQCTAIKADKSQCKGTAKKGNKYCSYHKKKYASSITHGRKSTPELLGIPNNKHQTFEEFYASEKPFDLSRELAYMRTLLVETRETMENNRPDIRNQLLKDFNTLGGMDLTEAGVPEEHVAQIMEVLQSRVNDVVTEYYGPSLPLHSGQVDTLQSLIDSIAKNCEKAKKIADGITLNVSFQNVGVYLVRFTRDIVFKYIRRPEDRAMIVNELRGMNLMGMKPVDSIPAQIMEEEYA